MKKKSVLAIAFFMAAFLAGIYLVTGCKKDVGPFNDIISYDVSGYVLDAQSARIVGAEVSVDGKSVATTDLTGKYTIGKLLPGSYIIAAAKEGYTKGISQLTVSEAGAISRLITLKKRAPDVSVSVSGRTVTATNDLGGTAATLNIPAGTLSTPVQISVTNLVGNEAPAMAGNTGNQLGVVVSLDCSDPTVTFPKGITLTFTLPFIHKPGDAVEVVFYNESTNNWDKYSNAIVNKDGKTASILIYNLSTWGAVINTTFVQTDDVVNKPVIIPYAQSFVWQSQLDFREGIPAELNAPFLYGIVERATNLVFSSYKVGTVVTPIGTNRKNILVITPASSSNPNEFGTVGNKAWELVKYSYMVKGTISYKVWDIPSSKFIINKIVNSWYVMPSYVWLWRPSDTFAIPANSGVVHNKVDHISTLVLGQQHQGGSGK